MSRFEIKMPKLGESITEGTIVSWSVKVGESVQEDDVLFEVNTAKVSAEIPSPVAGKVMEILCKEGDTVAVGTVVAVINWTVTVLVNRKLPMNRTPLRKLLKRNPIMKCRNRVLLSKNVGTLQW